MKRTKDEQFLLKLHELALLQGDPFHSVDKYAVGLAIGQNSRGVDNIVRHLAQANFVKKEEENEVYLTQNGLNLVQLLNE
jgi:Mn-dependent DtxR family transcriptional regulator